MAQRAATLRAVQDEARFKNQGVHCPRGEVDNADHSAGTHDGAYVIIRSSVRITVCNGCRGSLVKKNYDMARHNCRSPFVKDGENRI